MEYKLSLKWSLFIIGATGILLTVFLQTFNSSTNQSFIQSIPLVEQVNVGIPIRLKIPKINIDAVIEYVGLTPDGAMDVPKSPENTAWFKFGPRPGEVGNSVIAGHSGWKNGIPAVFDNLYKLQKGDKLYVEDEKGTSIVFIVREIRNYDPNADAKNIFSSNNGIAHLNLITCTGIWDTIKKSRSERLVVFADKE